MLFSVAAGGGRPRLNWSAFQRSSNISHHTERLTLVRGDAQAAAAASGCDGAAADHRRPATICTTVRRAMRRISAAVGYRRREVMLKTATMTSVGHAVLNLVAFYLTSSVFASVDTLPGACDVIPCHVSHTRLTHSYLIEHTDPPKCTNCNQLLSVKHILTECTSYDQARHQYYSFTDIKNILSLTPSQNILNFIF